MNTQKLIIALLFACFISVNNVWSKDVAKEQLADTKWVLKKINNMNAYEAFSVKTPYIIFNFDIDQVSGNSGCNYFSGKFKYSGGNLEVPHIESDDMACAGNSNDAQFTSLLNKSSKISLMNGDLVFSQKDKPVLIFARAQPLTSMDLAGVWTLKTMDGKEADKSFSGKNPTLEFDFLQNRITGNAGCNNYNSAFSLSKNVLDVNSLITTRMSCDNIDGENKFVKLLSGKMDIDVEKDELVIRKDNKIIMTFER